MNRRIMRLATLLFAMALVSCSESIEQGFEEANLLVEQKLIKELKIISNDDPALNRTYTIRYDLKDRVKSISDGESTGFLKSNDSIGFKGISNIQKAVDLNEFYQAPYDAFTTGRVLEYDEKGNPVMIQVVEPGDSFERLEGTITYDPNPNPFFHTLEASGLIDVLDRVNLNFSATVPEIVKARQLLPFNNIRSMTFYDHNDVIQYEVNFEYDYAENSYPRSAKVNAITPEGEHNCTLIYIYKTYALSGDH